MPINARTTTDNFDDCKLSKINAEIFTSTVQNQAVLIQLNVPPFGTGENWLPIGGMRLDPGYWQFKIEDFTEFGVSRAQGIRAKSAVAGVPAIITII